MLHNEGYDLNDCVLAAFGNPLNNRLRRLQLRHSTLTDHGLKALLKVGTMIFHILLDSYSPLFSCQSNLFTKEMTISIIAQN